MREEWVYEVKIDNQIITDWAQEYFNKQLLLRDTKLLIYTVRNTFPTGFFVQEVDEEAIAPISGAAYANSEIQKWIKKTEEKRDRL